MSTKIQRRNPWIRVINKQGFHENRFRYDGYQRPKHEVFGVVATIRSSRTYKGEFIREFKRQTPVWRRGRIPPP
jgi:hypothetical protein